MAAQPQPQLVRLAEVADTLGAPLRWVANTAGKDVRSWWTDEPACDFATAAKIAERWAANQAAALEVQRKYERKLEREQQREVEALRRERERQPEPGMLVGGLAVWYPGEGPVPDWMEPPSGEVAE